MNKVIIVGRLASEKKYNEYENFQTLSGTIAVDRAYKKDGETITDFINFKAHNNTAKLIKSYVHKGNLFGIEGSIQIDSYTGKDGNLAFTTYIMVDRIELLPNKKADEKGSSNVGEFEDLPFM